MNCFADRTNFGPLGLQQRRNATPDLGADRQHQSPTIARDPTAVTTPLTSGNARNLASSPRFARVSRLSSSLRPSLRSGRWSSSSEQVVVFVAIRTEISVAKNRQGPVGSCRLAFLPELA